MLESLLLLVDEEAGGVDMARWFSALGVGCRKVWRLDSGASPLAPGEAQSVILDTARDPLTRLAELRAAGIHLPVLVFCDHIEPRVRSAVRRAGAEACWRRPHNPHGLGLALARLEARAPSDIPSLHRGIPLGALWLDRHALTIGFAGRTARLSRHEFGVFEVLVERSGTPVALQEIRLRAWGDVLLTRNAHRVVRVYISRLRRRLSLLGDPGRIRNVRKVGYAYDADA